MNRADLTSIPVEQVGLVPVPVEPVGLIWSPVDTIPVTSPRRSGPWCC